MDGEITIEICNTDLVCCNAPALDTGRQGAYIEVSTFGEIVNKTKFSHFDQE